MQERIKKLLDLVGESDRVELIMLNNGFVKATQEHQSQNSRETLKQWRGLRADLSVFLDQLEKKYNLVEEGMSETIFKNKKAVHTWLVANGWQIAQSQFYKHCREARLLPGRDGGYRLDAVQTYAGLHVRRADTGQKPGDALSAKQEKKLDLELQREETRVEREQLELAIKQGKFVAREDHELSIVGRGTAFMAHLTHSVHESANDWIDLVDGDQAKADLFVAAVVEELAGRMSDFTADIEFEVILEANA